MKAWLVLPVLLASSGLAQATALSDRLIDVLLTTTGDTEREAPLHELLGAAEAELAQHRQSPEQWYDLARIRFWYADTQSLFAGMKQMKQAVTELETGMALDPAEGAAHAMAFLGYLYAGMPPRPLGLRDRDKAKQLLTRALALQPKSAANNYFYAYYLAAMDQPEEARGYLLAAQRRLREQSELNAQDRYFLRGTETLLKRLGP